MMEISPFFDRTKSGDVSQTYTRAHDNSKCNPFYPFFKKALFTVSFHVVGIEAGSYQAEKVKQVESSHALGNVVLKKEEKRI